MNVLYTCISKISSDESVGGEGGGNDGVVPASDQCVHRLNQVDEDHVLGTVHVLQVVQIPQVSRFDFLKKKESMKYSWTIDKEKGLVVTKLYST